MVSRVAKNAIEVPSGVDIKLDGHLVTIKGKLGQLQQQVHEKVKVKYEDNLLKLLPADHESDSNALAGTMRALLANMVHGVTTGFEKKLQLVGVGYRAKAQGNTLNLTLGFSHPVNFALPEGVSAQTPTQTEVVLQGMDKQKVGQAAANIRALRPPEPYKGKGVRYADEVIVRKEGKKK